MRLTEILHHLSTCHSTLSLGVRGYKLCISKSKVIEVVQDFFHPPKKEKDLYFWSFTFLPVTSYFQGIKSIVGPSHSSPSVLHSSPAHSWARGKMSYMAADARYTANYTQHSRYTTRNTGHFHMLLWKGFCFLLSPSAATVFRHASAALPSLCCNIVTSTCTLLDDF